MLDYHLATFDGWLQAYLKSLSPESHFLAVVTLLDQLDPKEYNWKRVSGILRGRIPTFLSELFGETTANIEFYWILSKFLMDQERAGLLWVNSQGYADLATYILEILHDKWVYNPYIPICANTNT